jgi:hypothetical protein
MRRSLLGALALAVALGALLVLMASMAGASHDAPGFKTAKAPYLIPTAPGVVVDPILSTGDIVPGSHTQPSIGGPPVPYQMTGIPDGIGAYASRGDHGRGDDDDDDDDGGGHASDRVVVVFNHETGATFPGPVTGPAGVNARITRLEIEKRTRTVLDAEYLFTGHEGFERFCSSFLTMIHGRPMYFTGEEAVGAGHDGTAIAMDPETGMWRPVPHWGRLQHENVVPLRLSKWIILTTEDDFRQPPLLPEFPTGAVPSYLYAYIANDFNRAVRGVDGQLHVFKADNTAKNQNATVVKGESIPGRFVPLSQAPDNATSGSLKGAATRENAFRFDRLEDLDPFPDKKGRVYFVDTGKPPQTLRGRMYQLDINPRDPTRATLRMVLNGDPPNNDDIVNPDNIDASEKVLVIQEDRESAFRGAPSRVLVWNYDLNSQPREVARVARPETAARFNWESSGIFDASHLLGKDWWLLDVQAHDQQQLQPGPTLVPNTVSGEDGQFLAIKIPNSTGDGRGDDDDDDDDD